MAEDTEHGETFLALMMLQNVISRAGFT